MKRDVILQNLKAVCNLNGHVIGAVAGSGMTARYAVLGGANFLLALSAGKFRSMGRGSLASYFCFGNSNQIVMEMGQRELLPLLSDVPILFGIFASDPTVALPEYIAEIRTAGFSGLVNFPTVALIDGQFREALEEDGCTYAAEVEAIRLAHAQDLFTVAFVTDEDQTRKMLDAGADVICVHLGVTKGGFMGARKSISLDEARRIVDRLFAICAEVRPEAIRMVYAGPANTPLDAQYLYGNTACQGYIGGSTFDRIPSERAIVQSIRDFRSLDRNDPIQQLLSGKLNSATYIRTVRDYIAQHYNSKVQLGDLALLLNVSLSYLSTKFAAEVGCSFTEYLLRYRMDKAAELLQEGGLSCKEVAERVGYEDYAQFSKMFKQYKGASPAQFRSAHATQRGASADDNV
ncbi:MAG: phosphoenolpyruvate hydrolase family protein [Mogibacterium sp.]|nr:phosphoenolpyruvate hydrolase family protein [Mogibacterium sp.]